MNSTELLFDRDDRCDGGFTSCQGWSADVREFFSNKDVVHLAVERLCDQSGDLDMGFVWRRHVLDLIDRRC